MFTTEGNTASITSTASFPAVLNETISEEDDDEQYLKKMMMN